MAEIINDGWGLKQLIITKDWGSQPPTYTGHITFENGKKDEMKFQVPPDRLERMLELVSDSIISSAQQLGRGLLQSIQPRLVHKEEGLTALPGLDSDK